MKNKKKLNIIIINYRFISFSNYFIFALKSPNKLNEFEVKYKNNLLILNLFFIFLPLFFFIFFSSTFLGPNIPL